VREKQEIAIEHALELTATQQKLARCKVYHPAKILAVAERKAEIGTHIILTK
jgi:hypothetical protein